jgi:hypothetical protein
MRFEPGQKIDRIANNGDIRAHVVASDGEKTLCGLEIHQHQRAIGNALCTRCERIAAREPEPRSEIDPEALAQMKERGGTWAAYENKALDSVNAGHLQFLKVGPGCTYAVGPEQYPMDNANGMGWRYRFVGMVNLEKGEVMR